MRGRRGASEWGQALPLALGAALLIAFAALALAAIGGGATSKARVQRVADLAALSGARSMRDDFGRLFAPSRLADGRPNPRHLGKPAYLARAADAAVEAAERNGADPDRIRVEFPDVRSFAPLRVRVELTARFAPDAEATRGDRHRRGGFDRPVVVAAIAAASPPSGDAGGASAAPGRASGGGYSGPLVYRQGEGMRPDVAAAFDRMAASATRAGIMLAVNSGFRSDAEQAILFAQNPDPRMVAPPGQSLHRCATELDLGPPSAYAWLAANATRFGFVQRYSWEPWHYGFIAGPPPCSAEAERSGSAVYAGGDGSAAELSLPAFVPAQFREPLLRAASRWNVSPALLAAQLMAESNFNPFAVSPAGAQGIAQFMPATAAAYGLDDPFDPAAAIDAQAHLMADLLEQFGSIPLALAGYNAGPAPVAACECVPPYPETQAYVARILGLMGGAGALPAPAPTLEVRLVE
jgi:Transglycosylase SLT domain/D-alanyl-D-alanine carboxypeptidase